MERIYTYIPRFISILRPLLYIVGILLGTLSFCALFKYTFINHCIGQACPDKVADITGAMIGVGGLVFTALALVPIFWVESKVKAAKEDVRRQVTEDIQKDVVNLVNAQLLVFRVHYDSRPGQLLADEIAIQDAVSLWPDVKKQEYPLLSKRFARTALELNAESVSRKQNLTPNIPAFSDAPFPSPTLYPSENFYPIDLKTAVQKALFYLEVARTYTEAVDRELLYHLACMYGFSPDSHEKMIRCMEQAIRIDDNVKEDFAYYQALAMLSRSCNREQQKLERIGRKLGVELPLKEGGFLNAVQNMDKNLRDSYIHAYAIKKDIGLSSNPFYYIKFSIIEKKGNFEATSALYYQELQQVPDRKPGRFVEEGEAPIALGELYARIDKQFYLITLRNE